MELLIFILFIGLVVLFWWLFIKKGYKRFSLPSWLKGDDHPGGGSGGVGGGHTGDTDRPRRRH